MNAIHLISVIKYNRKSKASIKVIIVVVEKGLHVFQMFKIRKLEFTES